MKEVKLKREKHPLLFILGIFSIGMGFVAFVEMFRVSRGLILMLDNLSEVHLFWFNVVVFFVLAGLAWLILMKGTDILFASNYIETENGD